MRSLLLIALAAAMTAGALTAQTATAAAVLWVNDDAASYVAPGTDCDTAGYTSIQAAVDAAGPGDTINVCPGTYVENVAVNKSDLTIRSTQGAPVTTVQAGASFYVFQVTSPGLRLEGLTIVPDGVADGDIGVNMSIEGDTGATIVRNIINGGRIGINLGCASSGTSVLHNTLTGQAEAGINIDTCEIAPFPGSHDNSIHHNTACSVTSTASIALGGSSNDNSIHHNVATTLSVFGSGNHVHHNITQAVIVDNGTGNNLHHNTVDASVCS